MNHNFFKYSCMNSIIFNLSFLKKKKKEEERESVSQCVCVCVCV